MSSNSSGGMVTQMGSALSTPFSNSISWLQLGAVVVFVLVVTLAWRQVVMFIAQEV